MGSGYTIFALELYSGVSWMVSW